MVLFHYTGHVPANTTETAPYHEKFKMLRGTIIQWIPFQPEECADLLKFWVNYHGFQLFPFNPDSWAFGFFQPIKIDDEILFNVAPYELDFYAINEDDSYEHEYHMYVNVKPDKPVKTPTTEEESLWQRLSEWLGGT